MITLLLLFGTNVDQKVVTHVENFHYMIFSFDSYLPFQYVVTWFDFEMDNQVNRHFMVDSGSAIFSLMNCIGVFVLTLIINLIFYASLSLYD